MRTTAIAVALSVLSASMGATPDYLPLKEGNQWTFAMSNGVQTTMRVSGFADVGTVPCAMVETTLGLQKSLEYIAVDAEGVKTYMGQVQGQEFRYDPPVVRIKLPYQEGDSWTAVVNQSGKSVTTTFQSIGKERVETPAGAFDCIKVYSITNGMPGQPSVVSISFYADGIGPVRQIMHAGAQQITATLVSMNVQPAQKPQTKPKSQVPKKVPCPKCGALVDANAKSCPRCGQSMIASVAAPEPNHPTAPATAGLPALEKYQSPDGKVVLYKPKGWNVAQGDVFGPGTYGVTVMEPQENAVVHERAFDGGVQRRFVRVSQDIVPVFAL